MGIDRAAAQNELPMRVNFPQTQSVTLCLWAHAGSVCVSVCACVCVWRSICQAAFMVNCNLRCPSAPSLYPPKLISIFSHKGEYVSLSPFFFSPVSRRRLPALMSLHLSLAPRCISLATNSSHVVAAFSCSVCPPPSVSVWLTANSDY